MSDSKKAKLPAIKRLPTACVSEFRTPMFPVSKSISGEVIFTKWGDVKIERGNPLARHRDYLDAISLCREASSYDSVGRLHVAFDFAKVKKILNVESDWGDAREFLVDLASTVISTRKPGETGWHSWTVLSDVKDSTADAERDGWQFKGKLKKIIFHEKAVDFLIRDAKIFLSRDVTVKVLGLKHQVSRSVARWCLSHSGDQNHSLRDVLAAVGVRCGDRVRRRYVSQLHKDDSGLQELGVTVEDGMLRYRRLGKGIFIEGSCQVITDEYAADPLTAVFDTVIYETDPLTAVSDLLTAVSDPLTAVS
jgi:hypothetical protein